MPRQDPFKTTADQVPGLRKATPTRRTDAGGQTWDDRNKPSSFRIREMDAERLESHAREMGIAKDAIARALLWAALDALEDGRLSLDAFTMQTEITDKRGRVRSYVRWEAEPVWTDVAESGSERLNP